MLRVPIIQAKPGMVLATPMLHPERSDTVLLQEGFILDKPTIDRLAAMKHNEVWIEYPELDFLTPFINSEIIAARGKTTRLLKESFAHLNQETAAQLEYGSFRAAVDSLIHTLLDNPRAAFCMQDLCEGDDALARHSSNVCFLSVLIGLKLTGYLIRERRRLPSHRAKDVVNLGVAAMLHDIGMRFITADARNRWYTTHNTDDPEWRTHPRLGFRALRGNIAPSACAAVLHHHQHFDGSGFPAMQVSTERITRPLRGHEIHIFARIITCADLYERYRNPPGAASPTPRVAALRRLLDEPARHWIDPVVLSGLFQVVPAYAPGTIVTLSDGRRAAVARWSPEAPCRPRVLILDERDAQRARVWARSEQVFIELTDRTDLHIAAVDGQNVASLNFEPPQPDEPGATGWLRVPDNTDIEADDHQHLDAA